MIPWHRYAGQMHHSRPSLFIGLRVSAKTGLLIEEDADALRVETRRAHGGAHLQQHDREVGPVAVDYHLSLDLYVCPPAPATMSS
jgi:hypothetical protein